MKRKGPLARPRHRWEDNIKVDGKEMGWAGTCWIYVAQARRKW